MSAAFGIASIVQAVHTLYAPLTTDDVRRQADQFLQSFQADSSAWQTGHELLTAAALPGADPSRMHELRFFAAQTMHTKFKYDFAQLPVNLHEQMRNVVLGYLTQFKDVGAPLRPQIALVVAALTVQLSSWQQPVESLIAQFGNDATALILLDVLCELPEECRSDRTVITADARRSARAKMTTAAPQVLQLLNMYLQMTGNNRQLQAQVLRCLASWAEFGGFPADQLATNPLLALTFQALQVPDLICPARDCICQFIYSCRDMAKSAPLVGVLIPNILQLGPLFAKTLKDEEEEDDCECTQAFCHIFTDLADIFMQWILQTSPEALQLFQLVLQCTAHKNHKVARYTMDFWLYLGESIRNLPDGRRGVICQALAPMARELLRIMTIQVHPVDETLPEEQREEQRRFRYSCGDVVLEVVGTILGGSEALGSIMVLLQSHFQEFQRNSAKWEGLEASLYCIRSIARIIDENEQVYLPQLMAFLCQLPAELAKVRYTATLIIGRYAFWLSKRPDMMVPLLQYVVHGLNYSDIQAAAALALKNIILDCGEYILTQPALVENLFTLYTTSASGLALSHIDQCELLVGMVHLVSISPATGDAQNIALGRVVKPIFDDISKYVNACNGIQTASDLSKSTEIVRRALDRISDLFSKIDLSVPRGQKAAASATNPLVSLVTQAAPVLLGLFESFKGDEKSMESLTRTFKFIIRKLREHFLPFVHSLMQAVAHYFPVAHFSCLLYLASVLVENLGYAPELTQSFGQLLVAVSQPALAMLNSLQSMSERPDVVEDFFCLVGDFLLHCPHLMTQAHLVEPVFRAGLMGLRMQHRSAFSRVAMTVRLIVWNALPTPDRNLLDEDDERATRYRPLPARAQADVMVFQQAVMQHTSALVGFIVECFAGSAHQSQLKLFHHIFEVIRALPDNAWLHMMTPALQALAIATDSEKQALVQSLSASDSSWKSREAATFDFWHNCRSRTIRR